MKSIGKIELESKKIEFCFCKIEEYPFRWEESLCLLFLLEGEIEFELVNGSKKMNVGDLDIIDTTDVYRISCSDDNLVLIFKFNYDYLSRFDPDIKEIKFISRNFYNQLDIDLNIEEDSVKLLMAYLVDILIPCVEDNSINDEDVKEFLSHLIKNFELSNYFKKKYRVGELSDDSLGYILTNYMNNISLEELSRMNNISSCHLSRMFSKGLGISFRELVNYFKLNKAVQLLLSTDKSITQIVYESGFSAERYFYKQFKPFYQEGPVKFRKRFKGAKKFKPLSIRRVGNKWGLMKLMSVINYNPNDSFVECSDENITIDLLNTEASNRMLGHEFRAIRESIKSFEVMDFSNNMCFKMIEAVALDKKQLVKDESFLLLEKQFECKYNQLKKFSDKLIPRSAILLEFIDMMGTQIIEFSSKMIITRIDNGYALLLTNPVFESIMDNHNRLFRYKIEFKNDLMDFIVINYKLLNSESVIKQKKIMDNIEVLSDNNILSINEMTSYKNTIEFISAEDDLIVDLNHNDMQLIIIEEVKRMT